MIVVDAAAVVPALLKNGPLRELLSSEDLFAPPLLDIEVAHTLRRHVLAGRLSADNGQAALNILGRLGLTRYPVHGLLDRVWELRDNLTAYDAAYVAVAEALECPLVTADARIAGASGIHCRVTVVRPA